MNENLPLNEKNSYVAFDGTSIRDLIINRLNNSSVFTDQNYQGSNLSAFVDIIGYSFSTLLYYLNKTSTENMFSESQIYENMNRIVKLINYNPIGRLGQNLPFTLTASSNIPPGNYFIPRYSYINVGGLDFSFNSDIVISKRTSNNELVLDNNNLYLLYQGRFNEYPIYTASGVENEVVYMALNSDTKIDHFNIFVYVKPKNSSKWEQWTNVSDFILYKSGDLVYKTRLNHNLRYEISFGDNVNGKKLNEGDEVAIYYLKINSDGGTIAPNSLSDSKIIKFNSTNFNAISEHVFPSLDSELTINQLRQVTLDNTYPSNSYSDYENVDNIRKNAPKSFKAQNRLITISDFESYISSNYSNLISDVKIKDNDDYLSGHIKYFYEIGLNEPQIENQILYNQIKFSSSCNFNNIYAYVLPKNDLQMFLAPAQKQIIFNGLEAARTITSNIVLMDPVYMSFDFYIQHPLNDPTIDDINTCKLRIIKSKNTRRSDSSIASDVIAVFKNTFNRESLKLGYSLNIYQLSSDILSIEGIDKIITHRSDTNTNIDGMSVLVWNKLYPKQDVNVYAQNVSFNYFQYIAYNNLSNLINRIEIVDSIGSSKLLEI